MAFVPRLTAPSLTNPYYLYYTYGGYNHAILIDSSTGSVLPNCVGYCYGRFMEEVGSTSCNLSTGNATNWYGATWDGYPRGSEPKLGAVICFSGGSDGFGHVAVVEQIIDADTIVCSNSAYGGSYFYTNTLRRQDGWTWSSSYHFQGFIYNPDVDGDTPYPPYPFVPPTFSKRKGFNFVLFNRRKRKYQNGKRRSIKKIAGNRHS